jgi:large subunit ribosomal protein L21
MAKTTITKSIAKAPIRKAKTTDSASAFAVFKTGGKQYRVSVGDSVKIEKIIGEHSIGDKLTFDEVLLKDNGSETTVGAPFISGAKVSAEIEDIARHPKVIAIRYIQKSRSGPKKNGHRQPYFKIKILSI